MFEKETKSYFYVYLNNFLMLLCVPIITILFLCFQAERSVENQIISANENTLYQFYRLIDSGIEEMRNVVLSVANDEKCITYARYIVESSNKKGYQRLVVKDQLEKYVNTKYVDILVYYPYENYVISGAYSTIDLELYWKINYGSCEFSDFEELLNCQSSKPVLCGISSEEESYLCVAMRKRNGIDSQRDFIVVAFMRPSYLEMMKKGDERALDGDFIILNKDNEVLIGEIINKQDNFEIRDDEEAYYVTQIGEDKYVAHMKAAESIKGSYAFIVPYEYFWHELYGLRKISLIGIAICIMAYVYMSYKGAKRIYRPVEKLLEQFFDDTRKKRAEGNEFELITNIVQERSNKVYILERKLNEVEDLQKQKFAKNLIDGEITNAVLEDEFVNEKISLSEDKFCVAAVTINGSHQIGQELQRFIVANVIEELYGAPVYIATMSKDLYAIIFCLTLGIKKKNVVRALRESMTFFEKKGKMLLSVGMGEVYQGVQGIRKSYEEALSALKYKWLLDEGNIIEYVDICERKFSCNFGTESKIFRFVMDYIKREGEEADDLVAEILKLYNISADVSMETIECFKYEVLNAVYNAIANIGASEVICGFLFQTMEMPTMSKYKEQLALVLNDVRTWYRENQIEDGVCSKVKHLVEKNYSDPELSVAQIGKDVNLTSSYLTKRFKDKYNVSVLDYITQTRINHAKLLLRDTSLSVKQISAMVGFLSDVTFVKTFKKWEGITPKSYRDLPFE